MSKENEQVIRQLLAHGGKDVLPEVRKSLSGLGTDPHPDAAWSSVGAHPAWQHYDRHIEWDMTEVGVPGVAHGIRELALWSMAWTAAARRHVYHVRKWKDLGDWVLTISDVEATLQGGKPVKRKVAQIWQVRNGKVTVMRAFDTERKALAAAKP